MPQSLNLVALHLIFSTRNRIQALPPDIRPGLYAYMAGVAREQGCECYRVGGTEDHVHLAIALSRTKAIAVLVEEIKTSATHWLKQQHADFQGFSWQRGYGVFSVSPGQVADLLDYIDNQEVHHQKRSFQQEYLAFLKKYGITYDERYVWD
jgi:putative transposase